jgi:hypothetical protein
MIRPVTRLSQSTLRRWTILTPTEVGRVERALAELAEKGKGEERAFAAQARASSS